VASLIWLSLSPSPARTKPLEGTSIGSSMTAAVS
jgi:hypothetical protein